MNYTDTRSATADNILHIQLLGAFQVTACSTTLAEDSLGRSDAGRLIKLLALSPGHALHREELMDRLWPDLPETALNNLRCTLYVARRTLEPGVSSSVLSLQGERIALLPGGQVVTDVAVFEDAAQSLRDKHGIVSDAADRPQQERLLNELQVTMSEPAFTAAWAAGSDLCLEEAIDEAATIDVTHSAPRESLSQRQREVAELIARGFTNAQVAAELGIAQRTVDSHVGHILRKLGVDSRADVTIERINTSRPQ